MRLKQSSLIVWFLLIQAGGGGWGQGAKQKGLEEESDLKQDKGLRDKDKEERDWSGSDPHRSCSTALNCE